MCKFTQMATDLHTDKPLILVTGALGFIGSCLALELLRSGKYRVVICDDLNATQKFPNIADAAFELSIDRKALIALLQTGGLPDLKGVLHIGARTDTTEFNKTIFDELNYGYSQAMWQICTERKIPLVYASSAATYGDGAFGYSDDHAVIEKLVPLNPYGDSKNDFDKWVLTQKDTPPHWYGLKFFNVYGPNEYHKSRMASVIFHAYHQFKNTGKVKLFRSHKAEYKDGEQIRDFIYVKDVIGVIEWSIENHPESGIYNLGTGKARSFYDLAAATAKAMDMPLVIDWIDIPEDIREKYQYFTEADMQKLLSAGYNNTFYNLEEGIADYVKSYLIQARHY